LTELIATGRIVDLILVLVVVEAIVLIIVRRRTGYGVAPLSLCANLAAGAFLLLALRAALVNAAPLWIGASLLGALVAHLADLALRWRR